MNEIESIVLYWNVVERDDERLTPTYGCFIYVLLFYRHRVLMMTDGIENLGGMQWELLASLFIGWLIIYIILGRGLSQNGKVMMKKIPSC